MPKTATSATATTPRRGRVLGALTLLGALASLWALFLWSELLVSRVGGIPFCAFGEEGCAALWDGSFAGAIHQGTGLPVAAWGLVWGLAAFLLPLAGLVRAAEGRRAPHLDSATVFAGAGGIVGIVVLVGASAAEGLFCSSCALTYVVVVAYGVAAFMGLLRGDSRLSSRGLALAAGVTVAAYLALLYPGLHTPESAVRAGERALAATVASGTASAAPAGAVEGADRLLADLVANLPASARQALADSLAIYAASPGVEGREPRALRGDPGAPVRITEFSDVLCSHCAGLHETLEYLETVLPAGSFSVDSRNFPLDGSCNPHLPPGGQETVRCLGARARICADRTSRGREVAGALFARQAELTPPLVAELAAPFVPPAELERCVASPDTARELAADIAYAWAFEPDGTPLVLVNGRRGTSFGPFLYAMVLTGGRTEHPAFAALPPANPHAHIH